MGLLTSYWPGQERRFQVHPRPVATCIHNFKLVLLERHSVLTETVRMREERDEARTQTQENELLITK